MQTLAEALSRQKEAGGALMAFNVQNILHLETLRRTARQVQRPVIAQLSARYVPYWEERIGIRTVVDRYQRDGLYLQLDHCRDLDLISSCIDAGFAAVMFDGSRLSLEENLGEAGRIYDGIASHGRPTLLEIELGSIGGTEDDAVVQDNHYYSMKDLREAVRRSKFDLMALAIGNAHGIYQTIANVKPELLRAAITEYPDLKLVLHGGTGLSEAIIRECIRCGVVKVNISTDLKIATQVALRRYAQEQQEFNDSVWYEYAEQELSTLFTRYVTNYTKTD